MNYRLPFDGTPLSGAHVIAAIMRWASRYETESGRAFVGMPIKETCKELSGLGWRGASSLDEEDFRSLGLEIVTARYASGVRAGRACRVIVAGAVRS